ncbi:MAG: hypothetical protein MPK10_07700, partial [Gammaproteobacteria bacterium]|nr:hypothetical protein [Gammaproteobacteria bacterium]
LGVVGAAIGCFECSLPDGDLLGSFLETLATVGALLASLTAVAIGALLALNNDVYEAIRAHRYKKVVFYAQQSILTSLLLALLAVMGFVLPLGDEAVLLVLLYRIFLWGLLFYALGAFYLIFAFLLFLGKFPRAEK